MIGVRTGDKGIEKHGNTEAELPARRRRARQGDRAVRGPARHARQAADAAAPSRQGRPAGLRDRREGAVGDAGRARAQGARDPHDGLAARLADVRRRVHLRHERRPTGRWASSPASTSAIPRTDPHGILQRFKHHPDPSVAPRAAADASYGAKAIPEGGWYSMPSSPGDGMLCGDTGGFLNGGRSRASTWRSSRACSRPRRSSRPARRRLLEGAPRRATSSACENRGLEPNCARCATSTRDSTSGLWMGMLDTRLSDRHRRGRDLSAMRRPAMPGHERMRQARGRSHPAGKPEPLRLDGGCTFDKLHDVYRSGTTHERGPAGRTSRSPTRASARPAAGASTAIPASTSAPPPCTRWCRTRRRPGGTPPAHQRLELRALQDLRHRRSVPDHHLGDARGRRRTRLQAALIP